MEEVIKITNSGYKNTLTWTRNKFLNSHLPPLVISSGMLRVRGANIKIKMLQAIPHPLYVSFVYDFGSSMKEEKTRGSEEGGMESSKPN